MLDKIIKVGCVSKLLKNIKSNARYYDKKGDNYINYYLSLSKEQALLLGVDALLKYKIIIDDFDLLNEYIEQLDKLFKKLDNFNDISFGINKLVCRFSCKYLGIKDEEIEERKEEIISFIYDKYVINGYYFHGFSYCYKDEIMTNGLVPDVYSNSMYKEFNEVNNIFSKYNILNIMDKDFSKKEVYFTDNIIMSGCYSLHAPGYFYKLLCNDDYNYLSIKKEAYLYNDYSLCINNLKKIFNEFNVSNNDRKYINDVVKNKWSLLDKDNNNMLAIMAVKRNLIDDVNSNPKLFDDADESVFDAIDRLLSANNTISCDKIINSSLIEMVFIELDNNIEQNDDKLKEEEILLDFNNTYGKVSLLLLFGSMLISLGVILTIIFVMRGI